MSGYIPKRKRKWFSAACVVPREDYDRHVPAPYFPFAIQIIGRQGFPIVRRALHWSPTQGFAVGINASGSGPGEYVKDPLSWAYIYATEELNDTAYNIVSPDEDYSDLSDYELLWPDAHEDFRGNATQGDRRIDREHFRASQLAGHGAK